jgi:threonine/homoserine/homoserine lactone efflux protein
MGNSGFAYEIVFLKGLLVGFVLCTPAGPVAGLCIGATLKSGRLHGVISGLGSATADVFFSLTAILGLGIISGFLVKEQMWFRFFGGVFLVYMGLKKLLSHSAQKTNSSSNLGHLGNFFSAFFLTLTNPLNFLAFAAVFAGLGFAREDIGYVSIAILVSGIFTGASVWWITLSTVANILKNQLSQQKLELLNRIIGIIIAGFGLFALASLVIT